MSKSLLITICFLPLFSFGQCVLTSSDDTETEWVNCLNACGCTSIEVPDDVSIDIEEEIDIVSFGSVNISLIGENSQLEFSKVAKGSSAGSIVLAAGSSLSISTTNTDGLIANNGGNVRITVGGDTYKGNDFGDIIADGGINIAVALPVLFADFHAYQENYNVNLFWKTLSEESNSHFIVEKSYDLNDFVPLGIVAGNGDSRSMIEYSFSDNQFDEDAIVYYRIKQVDFDGAYMYSDIIAVSNALQTNNDCVKIYPNPIQNKIVFNNIEEDFSVVIRDALGELYLSTNSTSFEGNVLDVEFLKTGHYIISIIGDTSCTKTVKIVKE